ncbi:MAG: hypothetical protein H7A37_07900 [Chlamydiales bacterium]|nr:hypothetical protein [Chlamydiia bacterium]MCP5508203.1 hypothetical protein [Chlamydiales bacterium]
MHQLTALAIEAGRHLQSQQTGFIHFNYGAQPGEPHDTIPFYENLLFALALFKSRTLEQGTEAALLLDRLVSFQSASGNFPLYLHDFPNCQDRFLAARSLLPLAILIKEYSKPIETLSSDGSLLEQVKQAALNAARYSLDAFHRTEPQYHNAITLAVGAVMLGSLLQKSDIEESGKNILEKLRQYGPVTAWYIPKQMGEILTALTWHYPDISTSPWRQLFEHAARFCHPRLRCYCGPAFCDFLDGAEPEASLLDLFLVGDTIPTRISNAEMTCLRGIIVPSAMKLLPDIEKSLESEDIVEGLRAMTVITPNGAVQCIERPKAETIPNYRGHHPFRIVWGAEDGIHSIAAQCSYDVTATYRKEDDDTYSILFDLQHLPQDDERENQTEVVFYADRHEKLQILVDDVKATCFNLDDKVLVENETKAIEISFNVVDGDGEFSGHIMPGNRLSQKAAKGTNRFAAYDWMITLRTLRRSSNCRIEAKVTIKDK